ncbi:2-amino-4-hydroxy-6-hydroxymethyldihydropteridine diphosphokinase [Aureliella helgolandensis]|uniref:2-amino-4-hydroxy-6-hydroxymethyldihydropteridine pyrophosphokinase n=1 Tax=Aureliella helgolandensis TaxID=2527968 RepID=A0A518G261_9BACT|nr:2-amino-4-hydroxy-6-hydroxymethyldihydropteridine diphosphokinase [Aureliella helgolandensis]QDV22650.1 2-amino-4-hydroxy-6-hydroxymethyldihydropteridine pyrophosphokinase [Aureliella helgolandensis]
MPRCLLSLGANLGNPSDAIRRAAERLREEFGCSTDEFCVSSHYRTPPVGGPTGQPPFINAVIALRSPKDPWEAWHIVRKIEEELGRVRLHRWEARQIDIDILLHEDSRIWTPQLKIPHPRMCMRRFILVPAQEVAASWIDPVSRLSIGQLAQNLQTGPGSLVLVASPQQQAATLLQEAARLAHANWLPCSSISPLPAQHAADSPFLGTQPPTADRRWVGLVESAAHSSSARPLIATPKLTVFLADPMRVEGVAWEDFHRPLAMGLGLAVTSTPLPEQTSAAERGPQPTYLLASDDRQWAIHELVAALEAMDCPIEISHSGG